MFVRLTQSGGSEINVNFDNVLSFAPAGGANDGSTIQFTNGSSVLVEESNRSIRGYIKKAAQPENGE